jgi:hypothetical protein
MNMHKPLATIFLLTVGVAGAASAQTPTNHLWPTFSATAGSYQVSSTDRIEVNGAIERLGREVNLGADFGLPERKSVFGGRFEWAFAEKHSIGLSTFTLKRDASRSINRDIEIGGIVFPIGATASVDFKSTLIEANYDYWFVRQDKLGFGASVGLVYLSLDAKTEASYRFGNSGQTTTVRESASTDLPVPMIGVVAKGSPWHWLVLHGGVRYLPSVTVDKYSGEAGSYSVGADFYVWGPLAIGAAYSGTVFKADIDDSGWNGSIDLALEGAQVYLRATF